MVLIFLHCVVLVLASQVSATQRDFRLHEGFQLTGGTVLQTVTSKKLSNLRCASTCWPPCQSATVSLTQGTCITFLESSLDININWTPAENWTVVSLRVSDTIQYNNWTMVFRAQSYINSSLYDTWQNDGLHHDNPLDASFPVGCVRLDNSQSCDRHFRSHILDNWTNIAEVKYSLFTNGQEVRYIVFDGSQTNSSNWFRQTRILSTSWASLPTDPNLRFFGIFGWVLPGQDERRFYIAGDFYGCGSDLAYTVAMDKFGDTCDASWGMAGISYPNFLYSPDNGMIRMTSSRVARADILVIFVKFDS